MPTAKKKAFGDIMSLPPYQVGQIKDLNKDSANQMVNEINRSLINIYNQQSAGSSNQTEALVSLTAENILKSPGFLTSIQQTIVPVGWRDLLGEPVVKVTGATDPTFAVYRDTIYLYAFSNVGINQIFNNFHVPHDYLLGSDMYLHVHWTQNVADAGNSATWNFDVTYSPGWDRGAFPTTITTSVAQAASSTQYQHMIAEAQLSSANPSAAQLDSASLEPDGVILVRTWRDPGTDTLAQVPFLLYIDIHYQSTEIGTLNKEPDSYN